DQLRRELSQLEREESRQRSTARKSEAAASLEKLRPGDIISVPGGRRAGIAVVLQPGKATANGGPQPLVLTSSRQVKRLTLADFPIPVTPIERIRIPSWFSPRSPNDRRDLASTVRNKLAGRMDNGPRRSDLDRKSSAKVDELRRRLRRHSCHDCPDLQIHLRDLGRRARLEREEAALQERVSGRSHVLTRTFDRVCAVLAELGYIAGDAVTSEGTRLAGLYAELDLLAAECLRRGTWTGLEPADLAACVSALTFESRREDGGAVRLPHGKPREALAEMTAIWTELSAVEEAHHLSFLREPDLGFAWTAYEWARGKPLEELVGPDLGAGDFVRAVKQLMDLLGQVAVVGGDLGSTARAAADALRRGVVAYSSVE
ncbi:MAG: RNA helicase, partial [Actinobacteria bacterium]|nr:RNA helicase [Actinomycetota bacterium]